MNLSTHRAYRSQLAFCWRLGFCLTLSFALLAVSCSRGEETAKPALSGRRLHVVAFEPRTYREGDRTVMPVVFPDGSTAEILYSPELGLAGMGATPWTTGGLPGCCRRTIRGFYKKIPEDFRWGGKPLTLYQGSRSPVEYWDASPMLDEEDKLRHLIYRFGSWYVAVWETDGDMTEDQLTSWALSLLDEESPSGFLILRARQPLELAEAGDPENKGPNLVFTDEKRILTLLPGECQPLASGEGGRRDFATVCYDGQMTLNVSGSEQFVSSVVRSVEVRNIHVLGMSSRP